MLNTCQKNVFLAMVVKKMKIYQSVINKKKNHGVIYEQTFRSKKINFLFLVNKSEERFTKDYLYASVIVDYDFVYKN